MKKKQPCKGPDALALSVFQYRTIPILKLKSYFACASFVFLCIFVIQMLIMPK